MDKTIEPITDDAELAKVLEGMQPSAVAPATDGLDFEVTTPAAPVADSAAPALPPAAPVAAPVSNAPVATPGTPALTIPSTPAAGPVDPMLETIKKDALEQLRPLVGKLNLPADEKFDTLLLIIRSTDDRSLVSAAYEAAKLIPDEGKRAEAMLDIIKEIDYFSNPLAVAQ